MLTLAQAEKWTFLENIYLEKFEDAKGIISKSKDRQYNVQYKKDEQWLQKNETLLLWESFCINSLMKGNSNVLLKKS
jgi:hypothetical protein